MIQSPSWETNSRSVGQEIPLLLWNTKVDYHVHKSPPLVPVLGEIIQSTSSLPLSLKCILIIPSIFVMVFHVVSSLKIFHLKTYIYLTSHPCMLHGPPTLASLMYVSRPDRLWGPPSLLSSVYQGSFPGVKRPGRETDHSPPSSAEVKECVGLYLRSPNTPSWRGA
jgi:hypothetical protein